MSYRGESAYDPIPAFWLEDQAMIGGIAEMTTLIKDIRQTEPMQTDAET